MCNKAYCAVRSRADNESAYCLPCHPGTRSRTGIALVFTVVGDIFPPAERARWQGIIALVVLLIYLPTNISMRSNEFTGMAAVRRIDFPGAFLASSATICLLLGLTWGGNQTYDWTSPQVIIILVAAVMLYGAFFIAERFAKEPILPLDLFSNQVFDALRLSLAVAIQHSFVAVLFFCGAVIIASSFLKDVPLAKNFREEASATPGVNEADTSAPIA